MKLNNKGFAISSIMYIILIMCIILITLTLSIFSSRNLVLDKQKKETLSNIYSIKEYNNPLVVELVLGLTPVVYSNNNWIVADTSKEWYNYDNQEWANAVILNPGVTKTVGQTVNIASEVKAMLVYIPRYEYKIEGTYGKGGTSASLPGEIEINFISKATTKASEGYRVHPAFTFGDKNLNGIWVGKFETTGTATSPTILPSITSLRSQKLSIQFETSQKFNNYITNGDSHLTKNTEWGAVAYLSQSKYGKYGNNSYTGTNKQVMINNCSSYITGVGADSQNASSSTSTCTTNTYNTSKGQAASTTGNITGIYDMSGGANENVMGYLSGVSSTWGATIDGNKAGFTSALNEKYYDSYTTTIKETECNGSICYGHALSETDNWYGDRNYILAGNYPWFTRGGSCTTTSSAGVFSSNMGNVNALSSTSFRVVISPVING